MFSNPQFFDSHGFFWATPFPLGEMNGDVRQFCGDWRGLREIWAAGGSPATPNPPTPAPSPGIMQWRADATKSVGPPAPSPLKPRLVTHLSPFAMCSNPNVGHLQASLPWGNVVSM